MQALCGNACLHLFPAYFIVKKDTPPMLYTMLQKNNLRRGLALLLAAALLCLPTGCRKKQSGSTLRADLHGKVTTLDPQYASTALECCILKNCMEGLLRRLPDGTLTEGVASDYTVSPDHKTYTFTLRADACWSDGEPVTANDFVFAFLRLQEGSAAEAAADDYAAIRGMNGEGQWGVTAGDRHTVVITLSKNDPLFLEKLAEPAAFPCRRDIYTASHARYGNTLEHMVFNGPFLVKEWDSGSIKLLANADYQGLTPAQSVNVLCTLNRADAVERFLSGTTDCCAVDHTAAASLGASASLLTFHNGIYSLLLNEHSGATAVPGVRQALCYSIELLGYTESGRLPEFLSYTNTLAPESARLFEQSYKALTARGFLLGEVTLPDGTLLSDPRRSNQLSFSYDPAWARAALPTAEPKPGQKEGALLPVEGLTLLLPQDSSLMDFAGWLQQQWFRNLGLIVNLEEADEATYRSRLAAGQYTLALYSYTAGDEVYPVFEHYGSTGSSPVRFSDPRYNELLQMAADAGNVDEAVRLYANAEALLMDAAVVMPLFSGETYFALGAGVSGITAGADGTEIFFANGVRR